MTFSKDRLLAESGVCLLTRKIGKNGSQTQVLHSKSSSSWVCRYQVAQVLNRHKVQRVASERIALNSRYLSRHGSMLWHQLHMHMRYWFNMWVLSHTRSAAQQEVWSRKTRAAAEACKIPVWGYIKFCLITR